MTRSACLRRSSPARRPAVALTGAAALAVSVLVPSAAAAPTEAAVVEPQWVLAEGTSSVVSTDVRLLDVAAGAVLVEEAPHLTDPGGLRVGYGGGLAVERRPVVPPGYGTVQLTATHVVAVDWSGRELHLERLDGSLSTELTLPAGTQFVGATPDGWLEVSAVTSGPGRDAVVLAEAVPSADHLTVTREPVGALLELPVGTVTGVAASVGAADAGRGSVAFVACAVLGDEGQDCALARFDDAAGAVSVLAGGPAGLGAVRAVNGAEVVVETGVRGPTDRVTTLRRLGDEGVVAEWTVTGMVDDVQDVGGRTTWRLWDRAQQAHRDVEGLPSGAVVPVEDVWWSDDSHRPVLSSGSTAWTTRAGAVVSAGPDGSGLTARVPARPHDLSVTGVDVDGSSVVWTDDSDTGATHLTSAWRRTIDATGPGARTRVLDRTVGWSVATVGGSTLAYRLDPDGNRELVLAGDGSERALGVSPGSANHARALIEAVSDTEVFARHFSTVPGQASRGALVDLATSSLRPLEADAVSADWQAALEVTYEYPQPHAAIPTSTITAKARDGSTTRVVTRPDVAVTEIYLVGSTLVWREHRGVLQPDDQEDLLLWVDLDDPATEVHAIEIGLGGTQIVAAEHGRVAVWAPERSVVEVYEPTVSAAPMFALEVAPGDVTATEGPRVGLGQDVVAWVVGGEQGDRLVAARIRPVPEAIGYDYSAGQPAIWSSRAGAAGASYDTACTGGYAVAGDDGWFLTTAAACSFTVSADGSIRGDAGYYADVVAERSTDPLVLLRMRPGNDAHQTLVDPISLAVPGDGLVRGWTSSVDQLPGWLVGKMGIDTGWTEGHILGTAPGGFGEQLLCTDAAASSGDVGGPVWRNDDDGLRALGTVVGISDRGGACYRPIQETLYEYGAHLPSFGPDQGRPSWGTFAPGMPAYEGTVQVTQVGRRLDKGDDWRP